MITKMTRHYSQLNLQGQTKEENAIALIQAWEPADEPIYLAFGGGKDSVVLLELARRAGVRFEAHYNITGIDPPELVKFVRTFPEVKMDMPKYSMWELVAKHKMLPLRQVRFCCKWLKEHSTPHKVKLVGVRAAESARRSKRCFVSKDMYSSGMVIRPILDWKSDDVWGFIRANNLRYCELYDQGFKRLGCLFCPSVTGKALQMQIDRYPKYLNLWRLAAQRLEAAGRFRDGKTAEQYLNWWLYER